MAYAIHAYISSSIYTYPALLQKRISEIFFQIDIMTYRLPWTANSTCQEILKYYLYGRGLLLNIEISVDSVSIGSHLTGCQVEKSSHNTECSILTKYQMCPTH